VLERRFIFSESIVEPRNPKREFSYEIRNVEVQNKEKIIAFFDDFIAFYAKDQNAAFSSIH
jgi:hypothetical protein